jgi:hypothetical protein
VTETETPFRIGDRLVNHDGTRRAVVEGYSPHPGYLQVRELPAGATFADAFHCTRVEAGTHWGRWTLTHSANWRRA